MSSTVKFGVIICFAAAILAVGVGWYVFEDVPVQERALRAYRAEHYKEALPLFEQWAALPAVAKDANRLKEPLQYVIDIKAKLKEQDTPNVNALSAKTLGPSSSEQLAAQARDAAAAEAQALANEPTVRVPHAPVKPGERLTITIKGLGNFPFDPLKDSTVPADVMALNGASVRLNGYMLPLTQAEKITKFALIPSLVGCCFGQPPGVEHVITCFVPQEKAVDFATDELVVEGRLRINIQRSEGYTQSIFELEVTGISLQE